MNKDVILTRMRLGKRIVPGSVAIPVLLIAAWAGYLFEPFAKGFESRTARQWPNKFSHEQRVDERTQYNGDFFGSRYVQLALTTPDEAAAVLDIPMEALASGQRIEAAIAVEPKKAGPSKSVGLFVKLRIAPGHYIYGLERSGKTSEPTSFEVNLPDGFSLSGPWKGPEPQRQTDGSKVYRSDVVFWNRLSASSAVPPGKHKISIKVAFQMCNEAVCWPPQKITRELELEVNPAARNK